jgi:two-component system NtrC family sensor kinase
MHQDLLETNRKLRRTLDTQREVQEQLIGMEKMVAIGKLVSGVAHELNNPLTGVIGYAQLLLARNRTLPAGASSDLEKILREAQRAARIVQNLLSFARKHTPEKKQVNIEEIIERIVELRAYELRLKNINVVTDFPSNFALARGDPHQLEQVFINFIINAEQAMQDRGQGKLVIRGEVQGQGRRLRVSFCDNGPGIPKEHVSKVFDPFFTTKPVGQGTGLGLSICYGIIREHGGRIGVTSEDGQGATFWVELPAVPATETPQLYAEKTPGTAGPGLTSRTLVVDDEPVVRQFLQDLLEEQGHQVRTAETGIAALAHLKNESFDLIILDLKMPDMGGDVFFRELERAYPSLVRGVIFTTGDTANPETSAFLKEIGRPVLAKPYKLGELQDVIEQVLGERTSAEQGQTARR